MFSCTALRLEFYLPALKMMVNLFSYTVKPRYNEIGGPPLFARYNQYFVIAVAGIYRKYYALYLPQKNSGRNSIPPHGGMQQNNRIPK